MPLPRAFTIFTLAHKQAAQLAMNESKVQDAALAKAAAMEYVKVHSLMPLVETLVNEACINKPTNPHNFMIKYLVAHAQPPVISKVRVRPMISSPHSLPR